MEGVFLGKLKDSGQEDWGSPSGRFGESPNPLKNPIINWMMVPKSLHNLRIQVCPEKGTNPTVLLWGWDWDHQS